jgi:pimeloyl-ACP methyl ester carboxylesterase
MEQNRRNVLATGAAATAVAAASTVFAQQPGQGGAAFSCYEKGNVRIRYQEVGSGFPLLVTPGGGLNSRISNWQTAVINAMQEFKNDFRCITMDQRNATGGESTGPVPVDNPWDAFADDQLGLMDHLGIRQFVFFGNCIGGSFALKLMERAPERVVAAVLSQPIGHRPENPGVMYNTGRDAWAKELLARRQDVSMETIEKYLHNLYRARPDFVYSVSRDFVRNCQTPILVLPDDVPAHPYAVAMESVHLAPNAQVSLYPWKDTPDKIPLAVRHIRTFLRAHRPVAAAHQPMAAAAQ